jgi:ABC-type branched-subunit amino acid transport system substrate-binding protein
MRPNRLFSILAMLAVSVIAVAACGSSGQSTGSGTTGGTSNAAGPAAGSPITIGFIGELSGAYAAATAPALTGAEAAVNSINAHGGLDRHELKMTQYDTESTASGADAAVRKAISDRVFALISTAVYIDGSLPLLEQARIPVIGFGSTPHWYGPESQTRYLFSYTGNIVTQVSSSLTAYWKDQNIAKVAVVGDSNPGSIAGGKNWIALLKAYGISVPYQSFSFNVSDLAGMSGIAQAIVNSGAKGVMMSTANGMAQMQVALNQTGSHIPVMQASQYGSAVAQQFGSAADGLIAILPFSALQRTGVPGVQEYASALGESNYDNTWAAHGWISVEYFAAGVAAIGKSPITQENLVTAMNQMKRWDLNGMIPPVNYPGFHQSGTTCWDFATLKGGNWVPAGSGFECGKPFTG